MAAALSHAEAWSGDNVMAHLNQASATIDCQSLDAPLNTLAYADQQVRREWEQQLHNPAATAQEKTDLQNRWTIVDADNLKALKDIIRTCGWPTSKAASHSAWLLSQHADRDIAFQKQARDLLEASVKAGTGAARDLAYLADRIAVAEDRPQEYGTQFTLSDECHMQMSPIDSLEKANARRHAIGLPSVEEYEAEGRRHFIAASCPAQVN
ncbi:hypothetical protein GJ698_03265 [Pseudoduganella sp. FT26W]|uniref:Uncharacterized protein n=1 Tax=Duganella aquatilis TaxID=2666082 RepID=A0A844D7A0_9BURK|nr:DUF6624 domain-containing protein [Duganella aquatilis]MRW83109.1 hypothetical protein [Duganella aquatilis]